MNKTRTVSSYIASTDGDVTNESCQLVQLEGEWYSKIADSHELPEFMMSLTGSSNHWMFISSYGALTAGRRNSNHAIFPYYSADKISDTRKQTCPRTIIHLGDANGDSKIWQPFWETEIDSDRYQRNLYKSPMGNKLCFEEIDVERGLIFRYRWTFSHKFGVVRTSRLINFGQNDFAVDLLDGFQNIVPAGADENFQLRFGNLLDAYKKSELTESGLGLYYLSSIPTDKAEPSEGLRATIAWATEKPNAILLGRQQIAGYLVGEKLETETDVRGRRGDYLLNYKFDLSSGDLADWDIVADIGLDQTEIIDLAARVQSDEIRDALHADIDECESRLAELVAKADGFQVSSRYGKALRHQGNVMFNIMRGGIPIDDYQIPTADLKLHVATASTDVAARHNDLLAKLPEQIDRHELVKLASETGDHELLRIVMEYLPLVFSRRHGDPTRPWNKFSIDSNVASDEKVLHYEGNWRDIFQNWEALAFSYPQFAQSMICRFLNASTADGYNPYRVTKNGFEWESPEPENPWANIGYWCDHQIIYLCKLLELSNQFFPGDMDALLNEDSFVYANVPYRIKPIEQILASPRDTVEYDLEFSKRLQSEAEQFGNDAKLLKDSDGSIHTATLTEKLLLTMLVKMSNFVPDGGVWLNTQRPEWNDANNALVGSGLSIVTTSYLRRYAQFLLDWLSNTNVAEFDLQEEVAVLLDRIELAISPYVVENEISISTLQRHQIVMDLSTAGSKYREHLYQHGLSTERVKLDLEKLQKFLGQCIQLLDATIASNRRSDGLYHAYNLMSLDVEGEIHIERLYEMLEGQVAVLSSGSLSPTQAIEVLDALRKSQLYREDQSSYMLYPNRELPRFLEKNNLPSGLIKQSPLLQELLRTGDQSVIRKDTFGNCHFNGDFRNRKDVEVAVRKLAASGQYDDLLSGADSQIGSIFENIFHHHQFTGRSGTFFAYEGLGSIYWHMVSKLLPAVSEIYVQAKSLGEDEQTLDSLRQHFREIQQGLGAEKTPAVYGAFPTDPYSHTPEHYGAQQPGMTGQVKEDILSRFTEMGVRIADGQISFEPSMLDQSEFCTTELSIPFWNFETEKVDSITLESGSFGFTLCGVPIVYRSADSSGLKVYSKNGEAESIDGFALSTEQSQALFARNGSITRIELEFDPENLS